MSFVLCIMKYCAWIPNPLLEVKRQEHVSWREVMGKLTACACCTVFRLSIWFLRELFVQL